VRLLPAALTRNLFRLSILIARLIRVAPTGAVPHKVDRMSPAQTSAAMTGTGQRVSI
jgi:hypothetical protein